MGDDAWKVKVAGRTFRLKDLEELTTKFLKYRLDSKNLLVYLKNSTKYDCPDLREVIVGRFLKEAMVVLDDPAIMNLSEEELIHLVEQKPDEVKIKEENDDSEKDGEKKETEAKKDSEVEKDEKSKKDDENSDISTSLVEPLEPFVKHIHWDHGDAEFFLKDVRNKKIMSEEAENVALTEMLKSFVDKQPAKATTERIGRRPPMAPASRRGPGRPATERGPASGPDLAVVGEKKSKNPGSGGVIVNKTDDELALL